MFTSKYMKLQRHPPNIASFYHLGGEPRRELYCQGTACFVARHLNPDRWKLASSQTPPVYCLGKCYIAPASSVEDANPSIKVHAPEAIVLNHINDIKTLNDYTQYSGYLALERALSLPPEDIVRNVETSELRGRGGAGFPTGKKWRTIFSQASKERFVIANADEGDPGAYIDRFIMENAPHRLIEGMTIAAYAIGARKGYIYLRSEYPRSHTVLEQAIQDAYQEGFLGERILNKDFSFDVEIVLGQGSYVCGEETALIRSIEGKRPEVMPRPPYPTEKGLFGKPTLVNNVETLANIPWIVLHGGDRYRRLGFSSSRGTKVVSLNSLFVHPGLYEIEFGIPVRQIVEELGGGLKTGNIKGVMIGGPFSGIIPPELLDTPFGFEELHNIGAGVGHGGIIAFDEHTSISELILHVSSFAAFESCGKCTPCRLGSRRIEEIFRKILQGEGPSTEEKAECFEITSVLLSTSLCGLGIGLGEFLRSIFYYYKEELETCLK